MKFSSLFVIAGLLIAAPALAYDLTYMGPVKAKETKTVKVHLPDGKSQIEVWTDDGKVSCQFATSTYGGVVVEQNEVSRCNIVPVVKGETDIMVSVTNLGKDSNYRIWVHDPS